jgi:hypothetical protein
MATDQELQAFFESRAHRAAELRGKYSAGWPASLGGCGIGCVIPFGLMTLFIARGDEWSESSWFLPAAIVAGVVAVSCAALGSLLYRHGQKLFRPVDAAVDDELLRPLAALLIDGATLEFPDDSIREWRASLLFPKLAHVDDGDGKTNRIRGRIAGVPVVLDEIFIRHRNNTFGGWVVHCALPFSVAGHLRVRVPMLGYRSLMWQEGFAPLPDATARLGTRQEVEAAAPGVAPEGAEARTSAGVPVETLLTDALFDQLRGAPKVELAATGRTLWVVVPGVRAFDNRRNITPFDADYGRKTAQKLEIVEAVAREVVRAGSGGEGGRPLQ